MHLHLGHDHLAVSPWWWAGVGLAAAYICWAVLTASRADPNQILVPGYAARARLKRALAAITVAALFSGGYVLAHDHYQHARVAAAATKVSVRAELFYGWAALTSGIAIVLILASSLIVRHRTPLPPSSGRGSRRRRRGTAAPPAVTPWATPPGYTQNYPPAGWPPAGQPLPARGRRSTRRGHRR